jgi:hypothetical protein
MPRLKTLLSNLPPLEIPAPSTILLNFTLFPKLAPEVSYFLYQSNIYYLNIEVPGSLGSEHLS